MTPSAYLAIAVIVALLISIAILKWKMIRAFGSYVARDEMPIWLSLSLAIAAAAGTYFLAPIINENFEFQKNRSAHVMQTVNSINGDFVEITKLTRKYNDNLFYQSSKLSDSRGALLDKVSELQWKLIDMGVVIKRSGASDQCVINLKKSLDLYRVEVLESRTPKDQERVISKYLSVADSGRACLTILYDSAKLS